MESEHEPAFKEVNAVEDASNGAYTELIEGAEVTVNGGFLLDIIVDGSSDHLQDADSSSEAKAVSNVPESKTSKSSKKPDAAKSEGKVPSRKQKALLSKSISFPAKVAPGNSMRKSTDGHPIKEVIKHDQDDDAIKAASISSVSRSNRPTMSASTGMNSNANAVRSFARQTSSTLKRSSQQQVPMKPSALEEAIDCPPSELESDTPRRASGSGFSSRLEERAERRKEFFSKMEKRIHAKEMEKINLQARSKENQKAEMKQMRKSLTFKAKPMPNFYKEPPPKTELKKIPITRPVSPKLGRRKSSTASNNSEGAAATPSPRSCHSPRLSQDSGKGTRPNGNQDTITSKTSIRKSYDKLKSQQNTKLVKPKPKTAKAAENHSSKLDIRRAANGAAELPLSEAGFFAASSEDTSLDMMPAQVAVEG